MVVTPGYRVYPTFVGFRPRSFATGAPCLGAQLAFRSMVSNVWRRAASHGIGGRRIARTRRRIGEMDRGAQRDSRHSSARSMKTINSASRTGPLISTSLC